MRSGRHEKGFTYLTAMLLVAVVGIGLAATGEIWSQSRQREKEAELLWIGNQFTQAIGLYYQRSPGSAKRYPERLEDLLEDKRSLTVQRYLRKVYVDPMSGKSEWGLLAASEGGIKGVYSLAATEPIKTGNFATRDKEFEGAHQYTDWKFVYEPLAAGSAPVGTQSSSAPTARDRSQPAVGRTTSGPTRF